ncbi:MAG: hypothetical protein CME70_07855 [Halobacteriovorax sp.]|nr:hypothetical protein [Halobacteriovorax sp.]|tara:strand:+ start:264207 stop:265502 length:1296 start_codon:yes stop_codon:yes gene_type:complete
MSVNILSIDFQDISIENTKAQLNSYWLDLEIPETLLGKFEEKNLFPDKLGDIFIHGPFSSLKVYFTQLLIDIIYINELIFEEVEDEIFDYWETSDFASIFFSVYEDNILESSRKVLEKLEDHFINYLLLNYTNDFSLHSTIKRMPEIGDFKTFLYLDFNQGLELDDENSESLDNEFVNIKKLNRTHDIVQVPIPLKKSTLFLRPGSKKGEEKKLEFKSKIEHSLSVLDSLAPELYSLLEKFTHTIIALDEPSMVSYSLQNLPGYSSINLFSRDRVDCIDDLIHENGHHYLNYILNSNELIVEDSEKAYYSPWRKSPRPLRGIYHGVFTFYWALKLFGSLCLNDKINEFYDDNEVKKIKFRFIEEFYMLSFCQGSLELARKNELITDFGWTLIQNVMDEVRVFKKDVTRVESQLEKAQRDEITKMRESLKNL